MGICGENLYATHSIHYTQLDSYFYGFGVYNDQNILLSWDDSVKVFVHLDITHVPVLYDGIFDNQLVTKLKNGLFVSDNAEFEGYVIRLAEEIEYDEYINSVMKWVRANHVQESSEHWMSKPVVPNELRNKK